jgi:hypothetical protein
VFVASHVSESIFSAAHFGRSDLGRLPMFAYPSPWKPGPHALLLGEHPGQVIRTHPHIFKNDRFFTYRGETQAVVRHWQPEKFLAVPPYFYEIAYGSSRKIICAIIFAGYRP